MTPAAQTPTAPTPTAPTPTAPTPAAICQGPARDRRRWIRTLAAVSTTALAVGLSPAVAAPAGAAECAGQVALTFDDGPSHFRPQTLQVLRDRQVPATFFDIGVRVAANPQLSAFEQREGHLVLNHTYIHPRLSTLSARRVREQVLQTEAAFAAAGVTPPFKALRPPFGATNDVVRAELAALGYTSIGGSIGSTDYLPTTTAQQIVEAIVPRAVAGSVIVMHDGPIDTVAGPAVIAALPQVIDGVRAKGLCFGLVDAAGQAVPATYVSSGLPIPAATGPVPFRPIVFGGRPAGAHTVLPPDLPAFDDLEDLLDDLRAAGRLSATTSAGLQDRLDRARALAELGSETRTIGYLAQLVDRARNQIRDASARASVVASATAIIEALRVTEAQEAAAG